MISINPTASQPAQPENAAQANAHQHKEPQNNSGKKGDTLELSPQALKQLKELQASDQRVRAHEAAHLAAAGSVAKGGASFQTKTGPDGKQYAVGGEVSIDASPVAGDPQATLQKARQIIRAAQAPLDPSPQDRSVAAKAVAMAQEAQVELAQQSAQPEGHKTSLFMNIHELDNRTEPGNLFNEEA